MIPALEQIIKRGGQLGLKEIVLGMPHRGRLNVLTNVMIKPFRALFHEFKGGSANPEDVEGSGDVKYHLGVSSDRDFDGNQVHLSLTANPSHLEIVDPVVLGKVRAKQDQREDRSRVQVLPLLLHGDAAFAGQGVVAECFGLSGLKGHRTGGGIHFIVNNQIGFTTAPRFSRSSPYPSDIARMIEAPIFHVNGDDPEAVVYCARVAIEFRQRFHKSVVIDMICYRRHGHNEGDEPSFTQPLMYKKIRELPGVIETYAKRLADEGLVPPAETGKIRTDFWNELETEFEASEGFKPNKADWLDGRWSGITQAEEGPRRGDTAVEHGPAEIGWRQAHRGSQRLHRPQDHRAAAHQPPQDDRRGARHRLVHGRGAGLRHAAPGRLPRAALGPGRGARHLLATPRGADGPAQREPVHPAEPRLARPGALRGHQLDAVRRGGAGLRIRL